MEILVADEIARTSFEREVISAIAATVFGRVEAAKHDIGPVRRAVIGRHAVFSAYKRPACCGPFLLNAGVLVEVLRGATGQRSNE